MHVLFSWSEFFSKNPQVTWAHLLILQRKQQQVQREKGCCQDPTARTPAPHPLSPQCCCTEVAGVILKSAKLVKSLAHFCSKRYGLMVPNKTSLPRGFLPYLKFLRHGPSHPEPSPAPLEEESGASFSPGATFSWWRREGWRWLLAQKNGQERGFQARTISSSRQAPRSTGNLKRFWFTGLPQACCDLFQEHSERHHRVVRQSSV